MSEPDKSMELVEAFLANERLDQCLEYLLLGDEKGENNRALNQSQIAERMGISDKTLRIRLTLWMRDGTMQEARQQYLIPKAAAMYQAINRAVNALPDMIDNMIAIGLNTRNPSAAIKAYESLVKDTIMPNLDAMVQPGNAAEEDHINADIDFTSIEP